MFCPWFSRTNWPDHLWKVSLLNERKTSHFPKMTYFWHCSPPHNSENFFQVFGTNWIAILKASFNAISGYSVVRQFPKPESLLKPFRELSTMKKCCAAVMMMMKKKMTMMAVVNYDIQLRIVNLGMPSVLNWFILYNSKEEVSKVWRNCLEPAVSG